MEIVDSQVHVPRLVVDWRPGHPRATDADAPTWHLPHQPVVEPAGFDTILAATLTAMDAAGVNALVIDEWIGHDADGRLQPGYELENGSFRSTFDLSIYASERYPERFSFLGRVDRTDPELDEVVAQLAGTSGLRCLRVSPGGSPADLATFHQGGYGAVFEAAQQHELPVFVSCKGQHLQSLPQYLERYPELRFIVNHLGTDNPLPDVTGPERYAQLEPVFELGRRYPNFAVQWSTVESQSAELFPYRDMLPFLLRALEAFGPERIVWASDWSQHRIQQSWAQSYWWLLDSNELSATDKEWILGRSLRTLLHWPAVGDEVGSGLYFDCAHAHPSMRITGATEDEFVASMRAHLDLWHPQPTLYASREHLLARARR